ncbi:MAG: TolC family protein [Oryzomonas sp.]|uniref:TolC family protein n=1 Tax=Oryzomonas sp. TaxID=2855186 RepID=UPI00284C05C0|nr:TolC family protein [Oryzomonas sp.]MDR3579458.1 TolC family protein [Oryzomonas sp.]
MIKISCNKAFSLCVALLLTLSFPAAALAMDDEIPLNRALEQFYKNNYDMLINKYEIDKAEADFVGTKLLPNPSLSFNYIGLGLSSFPNAGDNTQMTVRLDQLIELGGKKGFRVEAAQETLEAAKLGYRDTIRTLLSGFYTLFYNLKLDVLNAELAKDELQRFDRTLGIAQKRFSAGHLSLVDYTKIRIARIDLENTLTTVETQLKNDSEQFRFLIGSVKTPSPLLLLKETFPDYDEDRLTELAYQNRYDLLSLQKQQKAAGYNNSLAKAGQIPDITVGAEYDAYGIHNTPTVGFGFSIPLPLFNRNQGEIQRRNAEYGQIEAQIEKTRKQIVVDVRLAINNFAASLKVYESYKTRKAEMEELLNRSEKAFSLGGITALDLLDTQKTHRDFMTKYNQSIIQSNLNEELIKVATGEIK